MSPLERICLRNSKHLIMATHAVPATGMAVLTVGTCLLCIAAIPVPVTDSYPVYKKSVIEGENILLVCHVTPSPDIEVYWTTNNSKSTFEHDGIKLEFVDIRRESSGNYSCLAVNTSYHGDDVNRTVEVVTIDVQYPGEVSGMQFGPSTIRENQTWTGGARIDGNPDPDLKYYNTRTGMPLVTGHSTTVWFEATSWPAGCNDAGEYKIAARNSLNHGVWAFQASNLTVLCRPIPDADPDRRTPNSEKAMFGSNATLVMNYVGYPPPNITWEHVGRVLSSSRQQNTHNETVLAITGVDIDDYGDYTVTLANEIGSSRTTYALLPDGPPQCPIDLEFYNVTSNTVTLRWKSGFDMGSQQHFKVWKQIGRARYMSISSTIYDTSSSHGVNQTWTYIQTLLESDKQYTLTVNAENSDHAYNSGYAKPVRFRTLKRPEFHIDTSLNIGVIVGSALGAAAGTVVVALLVYLIYYRHMRTSGYANKEPIKSEKRPTTEAVSIKYSENVLAT